MTNHSITYLCQSLMVPSFIESACNLYFLSTVDFQRPMSSMEFTFSFLGRNGSGANIYLTFSALPDETCNHMAWFLKMLIRAECNITAFPIFTDQGNILAMARALTEEFGLEVSLKFCEEHIIRNMVSKFCISGNASVNRLLPWLL
jgi:hypothetical protein